MFPRENPRYWLQPCENPSDFRSEQCAAFDDVPYSGQLLKWYPHYDPSRPCALICRGEQSVENTGNRLRQETSVEKTLPHDATDALQLDSEETIVVQLADKVEDGTKCYTDSMDVCINGECMVSDYDYYLFLYILFLYINYSTHIYFGIFLFAILFYIHKDIKITERVRVI